MTKTQAFAEARKRWGKLAAIESTKFGAYIGEHDEFVDGWRIATEESNRIYKKQNPVGQYKCSTCGSFHTPKKTTTKYQVGKIMLGMFFEVRGIGLTWEAAFKEADNFLKR